MRSNQQKLNVNTFEAMYWTLNLMNIFGQPDILCILIHQDILKSKNETASWIRGKISLIFPPGLEMQLT